MHTKFWLENLKERDHADDLGVHVDGRFLGKTDWKVRTGFTRLWTGTSGGPLWKR